jgi:hypothetical protein
VNVLFVDDEDYRHDLIEQSIGSEHLVFHAFDFTEAVALLKHDHFKWGVIMLDHDLGTNSRDGSAIAGFILNELDEERFPAQAIVHSLNPSGAANIASKLRTANIPTRVEPFGMQMLHWLTLHLQPQ